VKLDKLFSLRRTGTADKSFGGGIRAARVRCCFGRESRAVMRGCGMGQKKTAGPGSTFLTFVANRALMCRLEVYEM